MEFLRGLSLEGFGEDFLREGFKNLRTLACVTFDDCQAIGISRGESRLLVATAQKLGTSPPLLPPAVLPPSAAGPADEWRWTWRTVREEARAFKAWQKAAKENKQVSGFQTFVRDKKKRYSKSALQRYVKLNEARRAAGVAFSEVAPKDGRPSYPVTPAGLRACLKNKTE